MSRDATRIEHELSRRAFAGLGVAAGATAALATLPGVPAVAGAPTVSPLPVGNLRPEALGTLNPALTYMTLDAFAFFAAGLTPVNHDRLYQDATGIQAQTPNERLEASLPIPTGSTIFQINVAYQGAPIIEIWKRSMTTPVPYGPAFQQTVPTGAGASTFTFDLNPPITIEPNTTVAARFFSGPGASVFGMTIGYTPPTQSFIPFTGSTPRVLDTREVGGKLNPGEERVVNLGFPGARGAVINLTLAETEGNGGFVAVFPADIAWPGNSSINWTTANQFVANGVISAMDSAGQIKIRGGSQRTQVIIDRIGFLI